MIPPTVSNLVWNVQPQALNPQRDADLLIGSVLARGGHAAVQWLVHQYGIERITAWLLADTDGLRTLPASERRFWLLVLAPARLPEPTQSVHQRWSPTRF